MFFLLITCDLLIAHCCRFLLFALNHIGRILPCCLAYLPDDGEEDEGQHDEEDCGIDPPVDGSLLGILTEPLAHEVIAYGEGD